MNTKALASSAAVEKATEAARTADRLAEAAAKRHAAARARYKAAKKAAKAARKAAKKSAKAARKTHEALRDLINRTTLKKTLPPRKATAKASRRKPDVRRRRSPQRVEDLLVRAPAPAGAEAAIAPAVQ